MVLRSSPWESRTSLTNKGHFALKKGPERGPFLLSIHDQGPLRGKATIVVSLLRIGFLAIKGPFPRQVVTHLAESLPVQTRGFA